MDTPGINRVIHERYRLGNNDLASRCLLKPHTDLRLDHLRTALRKITRK